MNSRTVISVGLFVMLGGFLALTLSLDDIGRWVGAFLLILGSVTAIIGAFKMTKKGSK